MCFIMLEKQLPYKYKVYDVIKKDILCGSYSPGDVLNERALSGQTAACLKTGVQPHAHPGSAANAGPGRLGPAGNL